MEQLYTNNFFTAFKTEDGILIEEQKKGTLKMIIVLIGVSILAALGGFILGFLGGKMGMILAPFLIWGGILILGATLIALLIKLVVKADPRIIFNSTSKQLHVRGKIINYSQIDTIVAQQQVIVGRTMIFAFAMVNGKKKSIFSTGIVIQDPREMEDFISELNNLIETSKH